MSLRSFAAACAFCATLASPASAGEVFGGIYAHDVDTFLTQSGVEGGTSVQLGWRGAGVPLLKLQPYAMVSAHSKGETHFAAVGVSRRFGERLYIRPGVGLAIHTGSAANFQQDGDGEIEFGSRLVFAPEVGIGTQINSRLSIEASWVHLSHGQLFGKQNPGMDNIGARLNLRLP